MAIVCREEEDRLRIAMEHQDWERQDKLFFQRQTVRGSLSRIKDKREKVSNISIQCMHNHVLWSEKKSNFCYTTSHDTMMECCVQIIDIFAKNVLVFDNVCKLLARYIIQEYNPSPLLMPIDSLHSLWWAAGQDKGVQSHATHYCCVEISCPWPWRRSAQVSWCCECTQSPPTQTQRDFRCQKVCVRHRYTYSSFCHFDFLSGFSRRQIFVCSRRSVPDVQHGGTAFANSHSPPALETWFLVHWRIVCCLALVSCRSCLSPARLWTPSILWSSRNCSVCVGAVCAEGPVRNKGVKNGCARNLVCITVAEWPGGL